MFRRFSLLAVPALAVVLSGCGLPREQSIQVKTKDPFQQPRAALQRYVEGQPMGSEATSFPKMVEDVRGVDQALAEILEKGFADLQKTPPAARPAKAQALLEQLPPAAK
jgi:hypothetical protein